MIASTSPLYDFNSSWLKRAASLDRQNLNGGELGGNDFEFITFVNICRNQRWLDLGLGFTRNGTPARVPSSSVISLCEQECPLAGGAFGCLTFRERSSLMGFRLLSGNRMWDSLACEAFTVPRRSHSQIGVGLPSMLLIRASWGFLLMDNGDGSCATG